MSLRKTCHMAIGDMSRTCLRKMEICLARHVPKNHIFTYLFVKMETFSRDMSPKMRTCLRHVSKKGTCLRHVSKMRDMSVKMCVFLLRIHFFSFFVERAKISFILRQNWRIVSKAHPPVLSTFWSRFGS